MNTLILESAQIAHISITQVYHSLVDLGWVDVFRAVVLSAGIFFGVKWWWKKKAAKIKKIENIIITRKCLRPLARPLLSEQLDDTESSRNADLIVNGDVSALDELQEVLEGKASGWTNFLRLTDGGRERYVSLQEYFRSLVLPPLHQINLRRILVTIASNLNFDMGLPVLGALPLGSSAAEVTQDMKEKGANMDPLLYTIAQHVMANALSPVTISAISLTAHRTAQGIARIEKFDPVKMMQKGFDGDWGSILEEIPSPFKMNRDFEPLVSTVVTELLARDEAAKAAHVFTPVDENYLPGLYWGSTEPSRRYRESPRERGCSIVLSLLFNRLSSNLYEVESGPSKDPFLVHFTLSDGEERTAMTVSEWLEHLEQDEDHMIKVRIHSQLTSFSKSICAKDLDGSFYDVPMAVPMRTGITALDGSDIIVPMCHAGVVVTVAGPMFGSQGPCSSEFYQNVGSFTGWHAYFYQRRDWHLDGERWHEEYASDWSTEHQLELVRCASILAVLENLAVREDNLFAGGYGYLGVCLDSVAVCQYAVMKETSIFPLLLSGQPRNLMISVVSRLRKGLRLHANDSNCMPKAKRNFEKLENALRNVGVAMINLATDIDIPPKDLSEACERLIRTLPEKSVFALVEESKKKAVELKAFVEENYYDTNGQLQEPHFHNA